MISTVNHSAVLSPGTGSPVCQGAVVGHGGGLRLPWLRRLRWTAVAGQTLTVLAVVHGMHVQLPMAAVSWVIGAAVLTNLALHRVPPGRGERMGFLAAVLGLDVVLLTSVLHLTGGPHNPFATLFLVLVAVAAVSLTPAWTAAVAVGSCLGYGWLFLGRGWFARPGDPVCGVGPDLPLSIHLQGMLTAYGLTAGLVAFFVARMHQGMRRHEMELARVRETVAENERFAALATLAAGAAHELGTPLGTMALVADDLARSTRAGRPDLAADADLIRREAFRCRSILDRLQNAAEDAPRAIGVSELVEDLRRVFPSARFDIEAGTSSGTLVAPVEALRQALCNLVGNGQDASPSGSPVRVAVGLVPIGIEFRVEDSGPGLSESARVHAGEPFFTTKPVGRGTGLGLYLVRLLARRLEGDFQLECPSGGGTRAILRLPMRAGGGAA